MFEQLENFVNSFPLWRELNRKKILPNWSSIGHSTHWAGHTLVEFANAWWDHGRKQCGVFLVPDRWKKSNWQKSFAQWNNCLKNGLPTAFNSDAADLEPLTSNQFLLRRSTIDYPNVVFSGGYVAMKKGVRAHNQFMKMIWDRWMNEYLPRFTTRKQWPNEEKQSNAVGDLVWVSDKQYHPFNYPMGTILELHTG